jgi:hypothetical protein
MKRYLIIGLLVSSLVGCPGDKSHDGHDHGGHGEGDGHDHGAPVTTQATTTETKTGN